MPTRNDQEYEKRRQQIIDGALDVFSRKGFEKATNRDIAEAAGIRSPGLVYHYFKSKRDLLESVLAERAAILQFLNDAPQIMQLPPQDALARFASAFLKISSVPEAASFTRLILGESLRQPDIAALIFDKGLQRVLFFLRDYFAHQMAQGNIRQADPEAVAYSFVGSLLAYTFLDIFSDTPNAAKHERMVAATVEIFLRGLEP
jgi:AcrR family transcriptional regulator